MDNQEAFNRVVTHLRLQGRQSYEDGGISCRYRSKEGLRCAVGVLLTDEFYDPKFEGCIVMEFSHTTPMNMLRSLAIERCRKFNRTLAVALPGVSLGLLMALQKVHDLHHPADWECNFEDVAQKFQLTIPPLTTPVTVEGGIHELVSR